MKKYALLTLAVLISLFSKAQSKQIENIQTTQDSLSSFRQLQSLSATYSVDIPRIIPSSPQSQIFEKYLNHEITEYNGLPQIEVPLYEIEVKGLKIPITLSYHAGGIKYKQYDGDVGGGWSINAGGYRVSRTVLNKPDELYDILPKEILEHIETGITNAYEKDCYLQWIYDNYDIGIYGPVSTPERNIKDSEYDLFKYLLPSTNGNFIISNKVKKETAIFEQNSDKILLDPNISQLKLNDIRIIDNNGISYCMGTEPDGVLLHERVNRSPHYITAWPLKQILTPYNDV